MDTEINKRKKKSTAAMKIMLLTNIIKSEVALPDQGEMHHYNKNTSAVFTLQVLPKMTPQVKLARMQPM